MEEFAELEKKKREILVLRHSGRKRRREEEHAKWLRIICDEPLTFGHHWPLAITGKG